MDNNCNLLQIEKGCIKKFLIDIAKVSSVLIVAIGLMAI